MFRLLGCYYGEIDMQMCETIIFTIPRYTQVSHISDIKKNSASLIASESAGYNTVYKNYF